MGRAHKSSTSSTQVGKKLLVARGDAVQHEHTRVVHPVHRQPRVATVAQLSDCATAGFREGKEEKSLCCVTKDNHEQGSGAIECRSHDAL